MRENWRDVHFWVWWWRSQVRTEAKVAAAALVATALIVGGYFASSGLTGADAASNSASYVLQTTVTKVMTVREHGKTVVKRIPVVVRRSVVKSKTAYQTLVDTHFVTTPGAVHYLTRKVVRYVPVVRRRVVHLNGRTTTLTQTRLVPTVKTLTAVVTNQRTVTNENTVVVNQTDTVVRPVTTVETRTITLPPGTVTQTETQTETQTQTVTVTQTETQTVTEPAVTITAPLP